MNVEQQDFTSYYWSFLVTGNKSQKMGEGGGEFKTRFKFMVLFIYCQYN